MIQAFSPYTSQETFTNGIGLRRSVWRAKDLDASCCCHTCKTRSELAVIISNQISWTFSTRGCLPQLLCHPGISGRARHIHMDHLSRLQFDDEKSKKWAEEKVCDL